MAAVLHLSCVTSRHSHVYGSVLLSLQVVSVDRMLTMSTGTSVQIASIVSYWPRYLEPLANQYPTTATPILLLEGTLDPQTENM